MALHWFNPMVWLALRRQWIECERACDDRALAAGLRPSEYAEHLLEILRTSSPAVFSASAAVTMVRRSQFEGRLLSILDESKNRRAISFRKVIITALASIGAIIGVATAELKPLDGPGQNTSEISGAEASATTGAPDTHASPIPTKAIPIPSDRIRHAANKAA